MDVAAETRRPCIALHGGEEHAASRPVAWRSVEDMHARQRSRSRTMARLANLVLLGTHAQVLIIYISKTIGHVDLFAKHALFYKFIYIYGKTIFRNRRRADRSVYGPRTSRQYVHDSPN